MVGARGRGGSAKPARFWRVGALGRQDILHVAEQLGRTKRLLEGNARHLMGASRCVMMTARP